MYFNESKEIEKIIKSSSNILLSLHQSPDPDSIVSNILFSKYLDSIGKKYEIVCFDKIHPKFKKTYSTDGLIIDGINVKDFDVLKYDLFVALDVNQPIRFGFDENTKFNKVVNIDHHATQNTFQGLKINDSSYSSTTEMLYYFLLDLGYKFNSDEANLILLGIVTDTDAFSYSGDSKVFETVKKCIDLGGNYEKVNEIIYRNNSFGQIKFWAEALKKIKLDKKHKFAYTALDLKTMKKYPDLLQSNRTVADKFIRSIEDTDFGLAMVEAEEGYLKISIRARSNDFNVMPLLKALNGGGHFSGGGGRIDLPFKKAVKEAIKISRKFAQDRKKGLV